MKIQPIETEYKGYRFRSRTEARWAIFFDCLGLEWEYEPEGYDLGGVKYLPDFWLKTVNMWAEVKGKAFERGERNLCVQLAVATGHPVLMLDGQPWNRPYHAIEAETWMGRTETEEREYCLTNYHNYPQAEHRFFCDPAPDQRCWDDTQEASEAARSARFEYGERP